MTRKLVTTRLIKELVPIYGADNVELAKIDGWQCVVKKGEFKVGDVGVYFEIDSFLPIEPRYEFLHKSSFKVLNGIEGFRIRTTKCKKQLSQGLLLPLFEFPELDISLCDSAGTDLTEKLNVKLYEPPIPVTLSGITKGLFPSFIPKTDAERIQNLIDPFLIFMNEEFEVTEKLDGSSMTVYWCNNQLGVCSRNLELKESDTNTLWKIVKQSGLDKALTKLGRNIALQGEIVGESVQKNPLKIKGNKFFLFNIWEIDHNRYLTPNERYNLYNTIQNEIESDLFNHVPIVCKSLYLFSVYHDLNQILDFAEGNSLINNTCLREGLVFKPWNESLIILKAISNKYLLKY
jgi:RNA ligase (TIGR02306 family)